MNDIQSRQETLGRYATLCYNNNTQIDYLYCAALF